jgi:hypothetical protein
LTSHRLSAIVIASLLVLQPGEGASQQRGRDGHPLGRAGITGRVTNVAGRAVGGVAITLLQRRENFVRTDSVRLLPVSARLAATTDSRGQYRFDGMADGTYHVAELPYVPNAEAAGRGNRDGYAVTFHPGVENSGDSQPVTIKGSETATADITLLPAMLSTLSGSVTDSTGKPARGGVVRIIPFPPFFGIVSRPANIRPDGTFVASGILPGRYGLQMVEYRPTQPSEIMKMSGARVTVAGRDIADIRVASIPMVRVTGRLVRNGSTVPPSSITVSAIALVAEPPNGPGRAGTVRSDMTFEFRTWPSLGIVRAMIPRPGGGSQELPATIRLNGADVTAGVEFVQGRDISGLEVVLRR